LFIFLSFPDLIVESIQLIFPDSRFRGKEGERLYGEFLEVPFTANSRPFKPIGAKDYKQAVFASRMIIAEGGDRDGHGRKLF
jgi:hypothetical protein